MHADSLSHVVCLIDERRRVVRVIGLSRPGARATSTMSPGRYPRPAASAAARGAAPCVPGWRGLARILDSTPMSSSISTCTERALSIALRPIIARRDLTRGRSWWYGYDSAASCPQCTTAPERKPEARVSEHRELECANRELQSEVARREAAEDALRLSRNELALLSQQLIQAQEKERRRIAQELHDSVGQSLSAIKYSLERAAELQRLKHEDARPLLSRTIGRVRDTIKTSGPSRWT